MHVTEEMPYWTLPKKKNYKIDLKIYFLRFGDSACSVYIYYNSIAVCGACSEVA